MYSPRAWGWTGYATSYIFDPNVFPTCVGVDRAPDWNGSIGRRIPHNSALDRLANASYQIVIEGTSYRERLSPHRREGVLTP